MDIEPMGIYDFGNADARGVEEQVECGARARLRSGFDPGRPLHLGDRDAVSGIPEHTSAGG